MPTGVSILMRSGGDAAHVLERFDQADRAVAAHAEVADVVEKDHSGSGSRIDRFAEQRADDRVVAARFADDAERKPS